MLLALHLALQLIGPADSDVFGPEVTEQVLQHVFNDPATGVVNDHQHSQCNLELGAEWNEAHLLIQFRNELSGTGEGNARCGNQAPVHRLVLADRLSEGSALVVDGESGDLLDKLEEVDGAVEERWLEFTLQIDIGFSPGQLSAI